jgi:hypothetical protein
MTSTRAISALYWLVALYDGALGAAFLLVPGEIYRMTGVTPPNHWAYVQFPASLLVIFALMFVTIARNPVPNRNLVIYGILLKVAYCALAFWYWFADGIPNLWKPFAVIDLITALLFVWCYRAIATSTASARHAQ